MFKKAICLFVGIVLIGAMASAMEEEKHEKDISERVDSLETMDQFRAAEINALRQALIRQEDRHLRDKHLGIALLVVALTYKDVCVIL